MRKMYDVSSNSFLVDCLPNPLGPQAPVRFLRQLALLHISIEAGILLCGNGVLHAMPVGRTPRRTHGRSLARTLACSKSHQLSLFLGPLLSFYSSSPPLTHLLLYVLRLLSCAYSSMLSLCEDYCLATR